MAEQAEALNIDRALIGTLEFEGRTLPYTDLNNESFVSSNLRVGDTEYTYNRSYPIRGYGAVMPAAIDELLDAGKQVLVAERGERYYVYVA